MTDLMLFDTLSGEKRALPLASPGRCGIYCCGPTTYDVAHIGHARAALSPDLLVRFLRAEGVQVTYVRNITDIDDKIILRANERGEAPMALSDRFAQAYIEDMRRLNCVDPDVQPKVTEHVPQIVDMIQTLMDKGLAYAAEGDVYYRVKAFAPYGTLSRRKLDELQSGARVEVSSIKEHPGDFALWKAAKPDEPAWDTPWGRGRPGWHIECSAMSKEHLGESFDVHTGGRDLIFPHHENEIAQSWGCCGEGTFAQTWMHNGFVNFAGEKMSKSLGNFFTIREILALYHPEVLRYFLLSVHYRGPINFDVQVDCPSCGAEMDLDAQTNLQCGACGAKTTEAELKRRVRFPGLVEADERLAYVYETLAGARRLVGDEADWPEDLDGEVSASVGGMLEGFTAHMRDDLNTAGALGVLSEALKEANRLVQTGKGVDKKLRRRTLARFLRDMTQVGAVLGVFARAPADFLVERRDLRAGLLGLDVARVEGLVRARDEARRDKDFARADEVRGELDTLGVSVHDAPGGSTWSL